MRLWLEQDGLISLGRDDWAGKAKCCLVVFSVWLDRLGLSPIVKKFFILEVIPSC